MLRESASLGGEVKIVGGLTCEQVAISGAMRIGRDCNAEKFELNGAFTIGGLLNAGVIDIRLHGSSRVQEIGGGTIVIQRGHRLLSGLQKLFRSLTNHAHDLTADSIEGDVITLEYTSAKVVRGKQITIGPGCDIALVEYSESLRQDENARVGEKRQV